MKKSANDCQEIDTETVKENIRQFMKNEALTVADLKELLGFDSTQAIYRWRSGRGIPSIDSLFKMSSVFDIPMEDFIKKDGIKPKQGEKQSQKEELR